MHWGKTGKRSAVPMTRERLDRGWGMAALYGLQYWRKKQPRRGSFGVWPRIYVVLGYLSYFKLLSDVTAQRNSPSSVIRNEVSGTIAVHSTPRALFCFAVRTWIGCYSCQPGGIDFLMNPRALVTLIFLGLTGGSLSYTGPALGPVSFDCLGITCGTVERSEQTLTPASKETFSQLSPESRA